MLQNLTIKNFRGLGGLLLHPLRRVNLIAGKNNTGKTAVLEALQLFYSPGNCSLPIYLNKFRGIEAPEKAVEDVCSWLFYNGDPRNVVEFSGQDWLGKTRFLTIRLLDAAASREQFPEAEKTLTGGFPSDARESSAHRILLQHRGENGEEKFSIGMAGDHGVGWAAARFDEQFLTILVSPGMSNRENDVTYFGEIELNKRQEEILPALRVLEPRLQSLRLIPLAGHPVIHGDIGLPRMVPIPMMGDGLYRVLSIVLAIANARGGTVLVDEIENGLHYSVLEPVWQAIAKAAKQSDVQVFATTHSLECIQAAHRAFKSSVGGNGAQYDFAYHRLDRLADGVTAKTFDREMLDAVETSDLEIR